MNQVKASNNKAAEIEVPSQKDKKVSKTTTMLRERLKFYMEQFNSVKNQHTELEEQLEKLKETGAKLSGSINALSEMLKTSELL